MQILPVTERLSYVWYGRHPAHPNFDMRLGGGAYVLRQGREALVFDVLTEPDQGRWLREQLERQGAERFTLVYSHWHLDHIAGACAFPDARIVAHAQCLSSLEEHRPGIESGEIWKDKGFGPMAVALPRQTFTDRLELRVGDAPVVLLAARAHSPDSIVAWLPEDRVLLAGDVLEDPMPVASPEVLDTPDNLAGLAALLPLDADRLLPSHGDPGTIRTGGYRKTLILANMAYLGRLLGRALDPGLENDPAESFLTDELARGEVRWWEPYREVHAGNVRRIRERYRTGMSH